MRRGDARTGLGIDRDAHDLDLTVTKRCRQPRGRAPQVRLDLLGDDRDDESAGAELPPSPDELERVFGELLRLSAHERTDVCVGLNKDQPVLRGTVDLDMDVVFHVDPQGCQSCLGEGGDRLNDDRLGI